MKKLYVSNTCPKCHILRDKLDVMRISYEVTMEYEKLKENKIMSLPVLELENGSLLTFDKAINYLMEGGK